MSKNIDSPSNQNSDEKSKKGLHNDFHPHYEDQRPVNIDGRPEEDFDENDHSLFVTRPRRY